jgi:hypothetical protein
LLTAQIAELEKLAMKGVEIGEEDSKSRRRKINTKVPAQQE